MLILLTRSFFTILSILGVRNWPRYCPNFTFIPVGYLWKKGQRLKMSQWVVIYSDANTLWSRWSPGDNDPSTVSRGIGHNEDAILRTSVRYLLGACSRCLYLHLAGIIVYVFFPMFSTSVYILVYAIRVEIGGDRFGRSSDGTWNLEKWNSVPVSNWELYSAKKTSNRHSAFSYSTGKVFE